MFDQRKAGKRLMGILQSGDHLIIDKLDRICRQPRDLYNIMDWMKKHQITLHIVNLLGTDVNMNTPIGEFTLGLFALVARWEAMAISERTLAHNREARKLGHAISKHPPMGTRHFKKRVHGNKWQTFVKWDTSARATMGEIVRLLDDEGLSRNEASIQIEEHLAQQNGRPFSKSAFYQRRWNAGSVGKAYCCEKYLRDHKITDVCDIPANFTRLALKHAREMGYIGQQAGFPGVAFKKVGSKYRKRAEESISPDTFRSNPP